MDCAPAALSCTGRAVVKSHSATRVTRVLFLVCNGKAAFEITDFHIRTHKTHWFKCLLATFFFPPVFWENTIICIYLCTHQHASPHTYVKNQCPYMRKTICPKQKWTQPTSVWSAQQDNWKIQCWVSQHALQRGRGFQGLAWLWPYIKVRRASVQHRCDNEQSVLLPLSLHHSLLFKLVLTTR